jgi:hypothetical protein
VQEFLRLVEDMMAGRWSHPGQPQPPNLIASQISFVTPVIADWGTMGESPPLLPPGTSLSGFLSLLKEDCIHPALTAGETDVLMGSLLHAMRSESDISLGAKTPGKGD